MKSLVLLSCAGLLAGLSTYALAWSNHSLGSLLALREESALRQEVQVEPLEAFHPAEDYHQDYAALHPDQPFIRAAALPKVEKLRKVWPDKVRPK